LRHHHDVLTWHDAVYFLLLHNTRLAMQSVTDPPALFSIFSEKAITKFRTQTKATTTTPSEQKAKLQLIIGFSHSYHKDLTFVVVSLSLVSPNYTLFHHSSWHLPADISAQLR
jgi:hypothetical protein